MGGSYPAPEAATSVSALFTTRTTRTSGSTTVATATGIAAIHLFATVGRDRNVTVFSVASPHTHRALDLTINRVRLLDTRQIPYLDRGLSRLVFAALAVRFLGFRFDRAALRFTLSRTTVSTTGRSSTIRGWPTTVATFSATGGSGTGLRSSTGGRTTTGTTAFLFVPLLRTVAVLTILSLADRHTTVARNLFSDPLQCPTITNFRNRDVLVVDFTVVHLLLTGYTFRCRTTSDALFVSTDVAAVPALVRAQVNATDLAEFWHFQLAKMELRQRA